MPIYKGTLKTGAAYKGSTSLSRIYKGAYLVFEAFKTLIAEGVPPLTLLNCVAEIMLGYRIYGDSRQGKLPDGYTQVEYLHSTGTQIIDTGFVPTKNTVIKAKFTDMEANTSLFGCRNRTSDPSVQVYRSTTTGMTYGARVWNTEIVTTSAPIQETNVVLMDIKNNYFEMNGEKTDAPAQALASITTTLALFGDHNGSEYATYSTTSIYYCQIWDDGVLVRDFVPCKNSSNVAGMYDLVNGVFYQNAGTGTFTAGANAPTPNAPIEIESVGDKTKNLWNSTLRVGCMKFADGQYLNYPGYVCNTTSIPVEAGENYTISANNYNDPDQTSSGFVFYNNGSFVSSLITTSLTVTIPSGVNQLYYNFRKQSDPSSLDPSDITNVQLEKGSTATSYEPYGYKIPVNVENELFDKSTVILDARLYGNTPKLQYDEIAQDFFTSDFIKVEPNTEYYYPKLGTNYTTRLLMLDSNKAFVKNIDGNTNPIITTTSTTEYVRFNGLKTEIDNFSFSKNSTTNIYLDEPLRKLGNYSDYIDFETQKVYRNVKKINLSTTLPKFSFSTSWDNDDYTTCYFYAEDDVITFYPISNYFKSSKVYNANVYDNVISTSINNYIYIKIAKTIATSKTELDNWLNTLSTPVEIIYQLASTTEESIELPDILLNKGTNIVDVETSITPSNLWVKYKGK